MNPNPPSPSQAPQGWRPRYSLGALLLVMLVCCVMAAAAHYLVKSLQAGGFPRAVFVIFAVAAPMLLLVVVSLFRSVLAWLDRRAR